MAAPAGTVERLKALTLMTYADISAVNPGAMTPWRAEQLWQLYLAAYNELTRELETERIAPGRRRSWRAFRRATCAPTTRRRSPEHLALEERSRARGVAVELKQMRRRVAADPGGARPSVPVRRRWRARCPSFGMNILKAEAFANRAGTVLDTFTFADPLRTLELNPSEVDRLRVTAERVVAGEGGRGEAAAKTGPSRRRRAARARIRPVGGVRR